MKDETRIDWIDLMRYRLQKLEETIVTYDAKLVIIDSIASVVRKEYDPSISHNMAERSSFLAHLAAILKHTAEAFSVPVWSHVEFVDNSSKFCASLIPVAFYARQHICYSAYMLSPVRPSVRLSHGCIIEKRLKLGL